MRRTKIVCTIGPASEKDEMLGKLIQSGMDVARINFSHGNYTEFTTIIKKIHTLSKKQGKNIAILQDLQGLKIRVGKLKKTPFILNTGAEVCFTISTTYNENEIPVQYKGFVNDVKIGERVLLADGTVELKVIRKEKEKVFLSVINGGSISDYKGINIPDTSVIASPLTPKDIKDVEFGISQEVDYIALSFVKDAKDIQLLRKYIKKFGGNAKIIAKIERKEALVHLEEIIKEADGVMVARGDLGVELSFEKVPLIQKRIIHLANRFGKPVITATQMLMSMVNSPVPTRAEVSDIANAVLDKTDAIMLSDETAMGKYPQRAVEVMVKTALEVENEYHERHLIWHDRDSQKGESAVSVSFNGLQIAQDLKAKYIVIFTQTGLTALQVSRFRPTIPMLVFTLAEEEKRQLSLVYGVSDVYVMKSFENKFKHSMAFLMKEKKLKKGDVVVAISVGKEVKEGSLDDVRVLTVE